MGLNSGDVDMVAVMQGMLNGMLGQAAVIPEVEPEEVDPKKYFEENTLKGRKLSDDDMVTVSLKEKDGYKAVFVRLGDLKKYILGGPDVGKTLKLPKKRT